MDREKEIKSAVDYFKSIQTRAAKTNIEFGWGKADIFHVWDYDKPMRSDWDVEYDSPLFTKKLDELGWTREQFYKLEDLIYEADCISISNGTATTVGIERSGMGRYSVKIFDQPLNELQRNEFNDTCSFLFYKKNIVFEYGSGAFGDMCFPQIERG